MTEAKQLEDWQNEAGEPVGQPDPTVIAALEKCGMAYRVFSCDPALADTAAFCAHYGVELGASANAIIVATKVEPIKFACCVILATTKLDVNKKVSQLLGTKRISFATAEQTQALTGMQIGGVTPFGLPDTPVYIDAAVFDVEEAVFGGGNRASKVFVAPSEFHKIPKMEKIEGLGIPKG